MTIERIRNAIVEEARQEARRIESEAGRAAEERLDKGKDAIEREFQRRFEAEEKQLRQEAHRTVMQKRSVRSLELLRKRNEIMNEVFDRAVQQLQEQDDDSYREMLAGWAVQIPAETAGEILCHSRDAGRIEPLVKEMNRDRDADAELSLSKDDAVEGGIVFRTGDFELDLTVRSRLDDLREELVPEVGRILFDGKG